MMRVIETEHICRFADTAAAPSRAQSAEAEFGGKGIPEIAALMGYDIDVFMGMNLVEQFYVQTDYKKKEITFSTDVIPFEPICTVPIIRGRMGEVCIDLMVKGECVRLALDTGAKISYIDDAFTNGETIIDVSYYNKMVDEAIKTISEYGDFEWFVAEKGENK